MGKFEYNINEKTKVKGAFNIYQARNGSIILLMGNSPTTLILKQIEDLGISCYDLQDFNQDDFHQYYVLESVGRNI